MIPPISTLPQTFRLAPDSSRELPESASRLQSTTRSAVLLCTVAVAGLVRNQVPTSLDKVQLTPLTSWLLKTVDTDSGWSCLPVMEAQPVNASAATKAENFNMTIPCSCVNYYCSWVSSTSYNSRASEISRNVTA